MYFEQVAEIKVSRLQLNKWLNCVLNDFFLLTYFMNDLFGIMSHQRPDSTSICHESLMHIMPKKISSPYIPPPPPQDYGITLQLVVILSVIQCTVRVSKKKETRCQICLCPS